MKQKKLIKLRPFWASKRIKQFQQDWATTRWIYSLHIVRTYPRFENYRYYTFQMRYHFTRRNLKLQLLKITHE